MLSEPCFIFLFVINNKFPFLPYIFLSRASWKNYGLYQSQMYKTKNQINKQLSLELKSRKSSENLRKEEKVKDNYKPLGVKLPLTLDGTSTVQLKGNFKQYKRSVHCYNHDGWTTAEQINKEFIPDLKNWKADACKLIHTIYKVTETTIIQARASTELYEQLSYLQGKTEFASAKGRDIFNNAIE